MLSREAEEYVQWWGRGGEKKLPWMHHQTAVDTDNPEQWIKLTVEQGQQNCPSFPPSPQVAGGFRFATCRKRCRGAIPPTPETDFRARNFYRFGSPR